MTCHILSVGWPLCGFSPAAPAHWKKGETWVGINDPHWEKHATCEDCVLIMKAPDPGEARKMLADRRAMKALVDQQKLYIDMGKEQEREKVLDHLRRHHGCPSTSVDECISGIIEEIKGEAHWREDEDGMGPKL